MRFSFVPKIFSRESVLAWISSVGKAKLAAGAAIVVIGAVVLFNVASRGDAPTTEARVPLVEVASVAALAAQGEGLFVLGQVRSETEAVLRTEVQGQVTRVNYKLGDTVTAGAVVAELSNGTERAAVSQARASLQTAEATLAEIQGRSGRTTATTRSEAFNTYRRAFVTADDAVQNKTEPFFLNDRGQFPQLTIPDTTGDRLEKNRAEITERLRAWERQLGTISSEDSDALALLVVARGDLQFIESFLNDLASAANRRTEGNVTDTISDTDRTNLLTARSNVSAELASLISAEDALRASLSGGTAGSTGELDAQLASAEAAVAEARARVSSALATLEHTIIRSPITGTINALNLEAGNFVAGNTHAVTIANNSAFEIETFVTAADKSQIAVGNGVTIDSRYRGTVTNIAPGLDPTTNKIKVEIGIEDEIANLTHGDTVRVTVERSAAHSEGDGSPAELIIPITALKVETDRIVVFTVSPDNTLVAHPVVEGPLVGSGIVILEGITADLEIVLDARGLNEGDTVEVAG